jgi:LysR family transcriptional regulator, hca operon transcriptional activator
LWWTSIALDTLLARLVYLPETVTSRPAKGEAPILDLIIAYHKANNSPILKLLLSSVGKLIGTPS